MPSRNVGVIASRVLLEQHDVGEQAGAGITTFDQIMREDAIFRKAPGKCYLEGIDIIDTLADE